MYTGWLNPYNFLVSLNKNEGQPDQNFTLAQPYRYLVVPTLTKVWKRLQNFYECGFKELLNFKNIFLVVENSILKKIWKLNISK